ncbi:MAG: glycosyltransferase [Armatimonadota bacterium]
MRILFVTPYVPSLIRVRPLYFIKMLSKKHEITLVTLMQGDKDEEESLEILRDFCIDIHPVKIKKTQSFMNCCLSIAGGTPLQAAFTHSPETQSLITEIASRDKFDILHVEHIRGAHLAAGVTEIPKVYDSVDCITRLLKQKITRQQGVIQRALSIEEIMKMRSYEPRVAADFDKVIITSEHDKRALERLIHRIKSVDNFDMPDTENIRDKRITRSIAEDLQNSRLEQLYQKGLSQISVVKNGVDSEYFYPAESDADPNTIAFSGRMSYFANATAVQKFYTEVFPIIKKSRPDAKFRIIGSDPPDSIRELGNDPSVEITGHVPDIRPYLASSGIITCPLTIGVGIQNKMLEAMCMGKPVVASSIACKGIPDAIDGQHLIRADDPGKAASDILELMDNPELRQVLGKHAFNLVRDKYSWESSADSLDEIYKDTLDKNKGRLSLAA